MVDERLLNGVRRFWSREQVDAAYRKILDAYMARLDKVTVIVSKGNDASSAGAQVVVTADDYKDWMEVLEARLAELEAADSGTVQPMPGVEHVNFGNRFIDP